MPMGKGITDATDRVRVDGKFFSRGDKRLLVRGVTYGPFAQNTASEPFPDKGKVLRDFTLMKEIGVNALRLYDFPPEWLLDLADENAMLLLPGIPWSQHVCFLDDRKIQREARERVRVAALLARAHPCLLGCVIGNEISPHIVRWYGPARVNRFLKDLMNVAKDNDPEGLVTYANFPPTEYLDLSSFDFTTFNIYLHQLADFRRYVNHLQIMTGDKPLLLGELGMDTMRHGEEEQATFLAGHLCEATLMGVAGNFVFSWTDEWHTGGHQIEDWAFGITRADRSPKPACSAVGKVFTVRSSALLRTAPRVSVVVCSYNRGAALEECLRSLVLLDYPDYEVILVDDGSTDNTREIAGKFPAVRVIHQSNQGLSAARNAGLHAATGSIIAYTDSDCFVDVNWLTHLVHQLEATDAVAVGGPNLAPDDGCAAACVAASPGQPVQVLESNTIAEHIPGCNMAFRREALMAINGFNPRYRKAGDDVDICWRLQQDGKWITFAPGAFVWHHRRQSPGAYLRQQAGYGEAEGLLWFDHPDRFNARGESMWRGRIYGAAGEDLRFGRPVINHGVWGTGLFQTIYQPVAAHWAMIPSTLEWHLLAMIVGLMTFKLSAAWIIAALMLTLSFALAGVRAIQAPLDEKYHGIKARLLIAALSYLQPLIRSWQRHQSRLMPNRDVGQSSSKPEISSELPPGLRWIGSPTVSYWSNSGCDRIALLQKVTEYLKQNHWCFRTGRSSDPWDVDIFLGMGAVLRIFTTQEDHGQGSRLIRVKYRMRYGIVFWLVIALSGLFAILASALNSPAAVVIAVVACVVSILLWRRSSIMASCVAQMVKNEANELSRVSQ